MDPSPDHRTIVPSVDGLFAWSPELVSGERITIFASCEDVLALPPKARGEAAEIRLVSKLMEMGITVAKPFGDSAKWDLIVEASGKISRLQVKSAWVKSGTGYQLSAGPAHNPRYEQRRCYRPNEIDFLVAYIAPEDTWFIFPVRLVRKNALFVKTDAGWPLARFRENWDLLFGKK